MSTEVAYDAMVAIALALLALTTGGVIYLTLLEWNDRRRRDKERRNEKRASR